MSNVIYPALTIQKLDTTKVPMFNTQVLRSVSLREQRMALATYPLYTITLQYEVIRDDATNNELRQLLGFFIARQGSFDSFLFNDTTDNTITDQQIGIGDGVTKDFQLTRTYGTGTEQVCNVNVLTNIKVNNVVTPTGWTLSSAGVLSFATAPGAGQSIKWTGTFYYRCRFAQDSTEYKRFLYSLWSNGKVEMIGSPGNKV
jgi:uncharacterized protein (TIGR02217 family)